MVDELQAAVQTVVDNAEKVAQGAVDMGQEDLKAVLGLLAKVADAATAAVSNTIGKL